MRSACVAPFAAELSGFGWGAQPGVGVFVDTWRPFECGAESDPSRSGVDPQGAATFAQSRDRDPNNVAIQGAGRKLDEARDSDVAPKGPSPQNPRRCQAVRSLCSGRSGPGSLSDGGSGGRRDTASGGGIWSSRLSSGLFSRALVCEAPSNFDLRSFAIFVLLTAPLNALGMWWIDHSALSGHPRRSRLRRSVMTPRDR